MLASFLHLHLKGTDYLKKLHLGGYEIGKVFALNAFEHDIFLDHMKGLGYLQWFQSSHSICIQKVALEDYCSTSW